MLPAWVSSASAVLGSVCCWLSAPEGLGSLLHPFSAVVFVLVFAFCCICFLFLSLLRLRSPGVSSMLCNQQVAE